MKKVLIDAGVASQATKVPFLLNKDDFSGDPALRGIGFGTGDAVALFVKIAGSWQDTALTLSPSTYAILLSSMGEYAITSTLTTAVAEFTANISGGILSNLTMTNVGGNYVDDTGLTFVPTGGNSDALVTFDIVSGSVANQVLTTPGTGYIDGTGVVLLGSPLPPVGPLYVELETSGML